MDSLQGEPVPEAGPGAVATRPAAEPGTSSLEPAAPTQNTEASVWRTDEFNDGECGRYHDCPAHTTSRAPLVGEGSPQGPAEEDEITTSAAGAVAPEDDTHDAPSTGNNTYSRENIHSDTADDTEQPNNRGPGAEPSLEAEAEGLAISGNTDSNAVETPNPPSFPPRTVSLREQLLQRGFVVDTEASGATEPPDWTHGREQGGQDTRFSRETPTETPAAFPRRSSSSRYPSSLHSSLYRSGSGSFAARERQRRDTTEYGLPRWQPDAEITYCPICNAQFSIFVRKHHCRKCGRVVCNSCSPHRIIIPHQYIVRQPGYEMPYAPSLFMDNMGGGYWESGRMAGGERVRLCNPCVPDPNTEPPSSPSPRSPHQRSRSSISGGFGAAPDTGRFAGFANAMDPIQYPTSRSRSITMGHGGSAIQDGSTSTRSASYHTPFERYMRPPSATNRRSLYGAAPSRQRALPPTPQIAEEDECPVCHRELPQRALINYEALREAHIASCIQSHSTYGSPRGVPQGRIQPAPRRSGMYTYPATEKDCVDDAECTICLEEFTVGVSMARLECLCRFHRSCIAAWFVNHPGRCPVHQHDGFGY